MESRAKRLCYVNAAAALLALAACSGAPKEPVRQPLTKIVINYPNKSGSQFPLFIAKEGGYYLKYGLDAELSFGVHPTGVAMLTSGQAQMVNSSLDQLMQAASKDGSLTLIGSSLNRATLALLAAKNITKLEQLKGKRIAIGQVGDAPYIYLVTILSKAGLTDRDVQWIPVGQGAAARAAALTSGRADATLLTAPQYFRVLADGYNLLVDMAQRDDIFAATAYLVAKRDTQADPTFAERLIKAHAEAIKHFYDDRDFAIQAYRVYDPEASPEDTARIYDLYARPQALERIPYVLANAVQSVLEQQPDPQLAAQLKAYDWKQVIDNSVVDRLVQQGFFRQLFGESIRAEEERKAALAFK
jgi:ABC-type nitrate/sulfonate/bicarbonate transport system substrate-binding protein